jgi:hypothetical protein
MRRLFPFLLALAVCALNCKNTLRAEEEAPDLTGNVFSNDGSPIRNATVFIYTAGPKTGTANLCPSCYPDCRKKASTDAKGFFKIESLDPKLLFRLLIVAKDHEPLFLTKVDPAFGPPEISLKYRDPAASKFKARISGMVINPDGEPVTGAVLDVQGVGRGTSTQWGGIERDSDPVVVSDDTGRFSLSCVNGLSAVHAIAEARGLAKRWVHLVPGTDPLIRLDDGATVKGRLLHDGKPVKDAVVGMITTERQSGICLHDFEASTDANGHFAIPNVTVAQNFYFFARMDSLSEKTALPLKTLKTSADGANIDLGDLPLTKGFRLAGRVVTTDGSPIPPQTRLFLGRDQAWDHSEAMLDSDGRFEFNSVAPEAVSISLRVKGYKLSKKNPSLDWLNGGIIGQVASDISDMTILMEPGTWGYKERESAPPGTDLQPRNLPLRGSN